MTKSEKTLSIVIPAYNEERYLKRCLDSIAAQTVKPDEVIVVDNNSTDKTAEIARRYPFVKLIKEPKQGIVYARTTGFNAAKSDIIGRIDADTVLPKQWIAEVVKYYAAKDRWDSALTGGGYFYNIRLPRINGWLQGQLAFRTNRLVMGHYILWGSNMAMPRQLWLKVRDRLCRRNDLHEDLDLSIHLHDEGYKITYCEPLRVGVYLKRVWSERNRLHAHMSRWPRTLHVHGKRLWWMGVIGNIFLWYAVQPAFFVAEGVARVFGKSSITGRR